MYNREATRISRLVVTKPSSHCRMPSLNPRRSHVLSLFVTTRLAIQRQWGWERAWTYVYIAPAGTVRMTGMLGHWRKSPECRTDCASSLVIITLKNFFVVIVLFILVWCLFFECGVSSEVLSDGVLFWLLSCGCYGSLPECQPLEILQSVGKDGGGWDGGWQVYGYGGGGCMEPGWYGDV